jgi:hypothetical protein
VGEVRDTLLSVEEKAPVCWKNEGALPVRLSDRAAVTVRVLMY